jgi:hypothetical protein
MPSAWGSARARSGATHGAEGKSQETAEVGQFDFQSYSGHSIVYANR